MMKKPGWQLYTVTVGKPEMILYHLNVGGNEGGTGRQYIIILEVR